MKSKIALIIMLFLVSALSEANQKFECQAKYSYGPTGIYVAHILLKNPTSGQLAAWDICTGPNCGIKNRLITQGNISLQNQPSRKHAGYIIYGGADQDYPFWIELPKAVIGSSYAGVFKGYLRYDMNDGPGVIPYDLNCRQRL